MMPWQENQRQECEVSAINFSPLVVVFFGNSPVGCAWADAHSRCTHGRGEDEIVVSSECIRNSYIVDDGVPNSYSDRSVRVTILPAIECLPLDRIWCCGMPLLPAPIRSHGIVRHRLLGPHDERRERSLFIGVVGRGRYPSSSTVDLKGVRMVGGSMRQRHSYLLSAPDAVTLD